MQLELFPTNKLAAFIEAAAQDTDVIAASRNWVNKRGGDLHPEDIRWLRRTLKTIDGYGDWIWDHADFMDAVAYGVTAS